jgi:hypothetical protein
MFCSDIATILQSVLRCMADRLYTTILLTKKSSATVDTGLHKYIAPRFVCSYAEQLRKLFSCAGVSGKYPPTSQWRWRYISVN